MDYKQRLRKQIEIAKTRDTGVLIDPTLLDPSEFDRWHIRLPEKWVDVETLPQSPDGLVKTGGQEVPIWKYVVEILKLLED